MFFYCYKNNIQPSTGIIYNNNYLALCVQKLFKKFRKSNHHAVGMEHDSGIIADNCIKPKPFHN